MGRRKKVSDDTISQIRALAAAGLKWGDQKKICGQFDLSTAFVNQVIRGHRRKEPDRLLMIAVPIDDLQKLVKLAQEQTRYIEANDKSTTGSIYGIEYADKTIAKIAIRLVQ